MSDATLQAMREWASAIRGDWSDIDGRSLQAAVGDWVAAIEGREPYASWTIEQHRSDLGLCMQGGGHWVNHCRMLSCDEAQP